LPVRSFIDPPFISSCSRSTCFWTLPSALRGRASTTNTRRGFLYLASCSPDRNRIGSWKLARRVTVKPPGTGNRRKAPAGDGTSPHAEVAGHATTGRAGASSDPHQRRHDVPLRTKVSPQDAQGAQGDQRQDLNCVDYTAADCSASRTPRKPRGDPRGLVFRGTAGPPRRPQTSRAHQPPPLPRAA